MNAFRIKVGTWDGDEFTIYTQLTEGQVNKVVRPMVEQNEDYTNEEYINALMDAYPSHQTFSYLSELTTLNYETNN